MSGTKEIRDKEINREIAEFMESKESKLLRISHPSSLCREIRFRSYTKSLDALVPVVEKLKYDPQFIYCVPEELWTCTLWHIFTKEIVKGYGKEKTMSRALALAIYEVIKEDKNGRR